MNTQRDLAIEVHGAVKTFGRARALDGLDLAVTTGEVHGFLGPNGAGKSTTLRALLGLLRTDARHAPAVGRRPVARRRRDPPPARLRARRRVAVAQPDRRRDDRPAAADARRRPGAGRAATSCSSGSSSTRRRRAAPTPRATGRRSRWSPRSPRDVDLLLLDEPTSGLDPLMEQVFAQLRRRAGRRRTTVLLSSHILSEVERLADRVTIIRERPAVESGSLDEMRHLRRSRVRAEVVGAVAGPRRRARRARRGRRRPRRLRCTVDPEALHAVLRR